jgi:hypothetical protein
MTTFIPMNNPTQQHAGQPPPEPYLGQQYPPSQAYQSQPNLGQADIWMIRPAPMPNCPPGLEYLSQIDKLLVNQKVDLLEGTFRNFSLIRHFLFSIKMFFTAFVGWEENNRYCIRNSFGQQIYYAFEDTDACMRQCCGARRGFTINIVDNMNQVY